jgi:inward rectifier potassium channel
VKPVDNDLKPVADESLSDAGAAGVDRERDTSPDDLGFGQRVAEQSRVRLLNPDGTFNVARRGLPFLRSLHTYHSLLTMSWPKFLIVGGVVYFASNVLFAVGFLLCGPGALSGSTAVGAGPRLVEAFFFSVQTLSTIGYGALSPAGLGANLLVTFEAMAGLMMVALATGLVFARFSRPRAKIVFSKHALIAPYRNITAFEFRIANVRNSQLTNVHATVVLSRLEMCDGKHSRRFHPLTLEREQVMFMPLHWVVVHPIDQESPLRHVAREDLLMSGAEFLILLVGMDETYSQTVHVRSSYKADEVLWDAKFVDMYRPPENGLVSVDLSKISDIEQTGEPPKAG